MMKRYLTWLLGGFLSFALAQEYGSVAPDFTLYSPTLKKAVQLSKMQGQAVVLNFWGSWCEPCRDEMPDLNRVAGELKDKFTLLAIAVNEPVEKSEAFLKQNGLESLVLVTDAQDASGNKTKEVSDRYSVSAYPSTIFIDKSGMIQAIKTGPINRKTFISYLRNIDVTP
jgi:thiol-disulfide isomerase/thioredoxin